MNVRWVKSNTEEEEEDKNRVTANRRVARRVHYVTESVPAFDPRLRMLRLDIHSMSRSSRTVKTLNNVPSLVALTARIAPDGAGLRYRTGAFVRPTVVKRVEAHAR